MHKQREFRSTGIRASNEFSNVQGIRKRVLLSYPSLVTLEPNHKQDVTDPSKVDTTQRAPEEPTGSKGPWLRLHRDPAKSSNNAVNSSYLCSRLGGGGETSAPLFETMR